MHSMPRVDSNDEFTCTSTLPSGLTLRISVKTEEYFCMLIQFIDYTHESDEAESKPPISYDTDYSQTPFVLLLRAVTKTRA